MKTKVILFSSILAAIAVPIGILTGTLIGLSHKNNEPLELKLINESLKDSKPTIVNSNMKFYYSDPVVTLNYSSSLKVSYRNVIKAEYSYTKEKLNSTSSNDGFITKETNTFYVNGKDYGILDGEEIKWGQSFDKAFILHQFVISKNILKSDYDFENDNDEIYFSCYVKNGKEKAFFNGANASINNIYIEIKIGNDNNIKQLKANFDTKNNAKVELNVDYSYEAISL